MALNTLTVTNFFVPLILGASIGASAHQTPDGGSETLKMLSILRPVTD
jgi:hypothetical protein